MIKTCGFYHEKARTSFSNTLHNPFHSICIVFSGLITLCNLERDNPGLLNDKAASRIKGTIARIGRNTINILILLGICAIFSERSNLSKICFG